MKRIIMNRFYDTDTAKAVGSFTNGLTCFDFRYMEERLYKKRTGEFFLFGYGGAMSKYCQECADGWTGSMQIIPLSVDEAKEWTKENLDVDIYMSLFGTVEE